MADTKERILMTALHLFARDGYEAVSVSSIAGELAMTKGALYKHYKNKRDIFDSIVKRMYQIDAEQARKYQVPEEKAEDRPEAYETISLDSIRSFTAAQYLFWTEDEFASEFRRMLTLEQYRNAEMSELYKSCLTAGPVAYMEDIFRAMIKNGILKEANPGQLALEYYAPLYLLISLADHPGGRDQSLTVLKNHMERFIQCNAAGTRGKDSL